MVKQNIVELYRMDSYCTLSSDEYGKTFNNSEHDLSIHLKLILEK